LAPPPASAGTASKAENAVNSRRVQPLRPDPVAALVDQLREICLAGGPFVEQTLPRDFLAFMRHRSIIEQLPMRAMRVTDPNTRVVREIDESISASWIGEQSVRALQKNSEPYTENGFHACWQRVMRKWEQTGNDRFTLHDLRATFEQSGQGCDGETDRRAGCRRCARGAATARGRVDSKKWLGVNYFS